MSFLLLVRPALALAASLQQATPRAKYDDDQTTSQLAKLNQPLECMHSNLCQLEPLKWAWRASSLFRIGSHRPVVSLARVQAEKGAARRQINHLPV